LSLGNENGASAGGDAGWTVTLDNGDSFDIKPSGENAYLDIAQNTEGTIVDNETGESISFEGVERIEF